MNSLITQNNNYISEMHSINVEMLTRWINFLDASQKTVESYTRAIKQFHIYLQEQGIQYPTKLDVIRFKEDMELNHKPTTVQAYLMAVKQFFKWTAEENVYPNIAENVKGVKLDKEFKRDYLTKEEALELLSSIETDTVKGRRDYAMLLLMLDTGMRTIEVTRANIEDIDRRNGEDILFLQGKGHTEKQQYVKLASKTKRAIDLYLKDRSDREPSAPLFISMSNRNCEGRMTTKSVSRVVKEALRGCGIDSSRLTAHSLRHTCGVFNLKAGGSLEETKVLLRHTNINTTMRYTHAIERENNHSEARVESYLFG